MPVQFARDPRRHSSFSLNWKNPLLLTGLIGICFSIFIFWLIATLLPVAIVEAKYQYRTFLQDTFGAPSLRALILPALKFPDLKANSKYKDYGITIPSLYLDEPVVFNVDPNDEEQYRTALKKGIAHASGTGFPDNAGIGYYFAHSSNAEVRNQYNAVFYLLGKLQPNDEVFIWHEDQRFDYVVTETRITDPEDVSFLNVEYFGETIVLQTCWPPGTTEQRLLVFAERVKTETENN
jgi:LPXTG-site transpeptidase (sortase) family protein